MNKVSLVLAAAVVVLAAGCSSGSEEPPRGGSSEPAEPPASSAAASPSAAPSSGSSSADPETAAALEKFEEDNLIPTSSWYEHVKSKEIVAGNSLWIYTDLDTSEEAKGIAGGMCGSYAQYAFVDEAVTVTYIRAADGNQLAKCGPGA